MGGDTQWRKQGKRFEGKSGAGTIKLFLRPLLAYVSLGCFSFLSFTDLTKLERLYRVAGHAISGCLSSSPRRLYLPYE